MTAILAAIDDGTMAEKTLATGAALASLFDASLAALHVRETGEHVPTDVARDAGIELRVVDGDPISEIVRAGAAPSVALVVVGAREASGGPRPAGHVALSVVEQLDKPVVVVPPGAPIPGHSMRRALVPLEGSEESATAVADALRRFSDAGTHIMVLHVFDLDSVPLFWDEPAHAEESFASEFVSRWCESADVDLHLRRGPAPTTVVTFARDEDVDLIALGWSQLLEPGRAAVVRTALENDEIPVLLAPVPGP